MLAMYGKLGVGVRSGVIPWVFPSTCCMRCECVCVSNYQNRNTVCMCSLCVWVTHNYTYPSARTFYWRVKQSCQSCAFFVMYLHLICSVGGGGGGFD